MALVDCWKGDSLLWSGLGRKENPMNYKSNLPQLDEPVFVAPDRDFDFWKKFYDNRAPRTWVATSTRSPFVPPPLTVDALNNVVQKMRGGESEPGVPPPVQRGEPAEKPLT